MVNLWDLLFWGMWKWQAIYWTCTNIFKTNFDQAFFILFWAWFVRRSCFCEAIYIFLFLFTTMPNDLEKQTKLIMAEFDGCVYFNIYFSFCLLPCLKNSCIAMFVQERKSFWQIDWHNYVKGCWFNLSDSVSPLFTLHHRDGKPYDRTINDCISLATTIFNAILLVTFYKVLVA